MTAASGPVTVSGALTSVPSVPPASHSDVLWQPRHVSASGSVAQYSRFVARMKFALPLTAGVILLLVLILPQFRAETDRFRLGLKSVAEATGDTLSMINARYFGTDDKGQPFSVKAASVRERPGPDKAIDLTAPQAELTMKDGTKMTLSATSGVYDRTGEVLDLAGQVDMTQSRGTEMHSTAVRILLKDNIATGDQPVTGKGSFGEIAGAGFKARQNDGVVIFTGPARLVLVPRAKSDTPAQPAPAR